MRTPRAAPRKSCHGRLELLQEEKAITRSVSSLHLALLPIISGGILFDRAPPGGLLPISHLVPQHFSGRTCYLTDPIDKQMIGKDYGQSITIMPLRNDSSSVRAAGLAPQAPAGMVLPCIRSARHQTLLESHLNSLVGHERFLAQICTLAAIRCFLDRCSGVSQDLWISMRSKWSIANFVTGFSQSLPSRF